MSGVQLPNGKNYFATATGAPGVGYRLYAFVPGTSTPKDTYTTSAATVTNTHPVVMDARGEAAIYWGGAYDVVLRDAADALVWGPERLEQSATDADLDALITDLADTSSASNGPGLVGYGGPDLLYAAATAGFKLKEQISVTDPDYGADPTGVTDSTAAFNLATKATTALTDPSAYRRVFVPPGKYKIDGTVYVPAGCHLHGAGISTYIDASGSTSSTAPVFKLGWSLIAGVPTSDTIYLTGGYPPEVSQMFVNGGPSSAGVIDIVYPGALAHDCWLVSPGIGVNLAGGYVWDMEIDGGLTGIAVTGGANQTIDNVRFFNQNYCLSVGGGATDVTDLTVNGCTFEYPQYVGVQVIGTRNKAVRFIGCDFVTNVQYGTYVAQAYLPATDSTVEFKNCRFNNPKTSALYVEMDSTSTCDVFGCTFDGNKTYSAYAQSTTGIGITIVKGTLCVKGTVFRNMPSYNIVIGGATAVSAVVLQGVEFYNTGGANDIQLNCTLADTLKMSDIIRSTKPLHNVDLTCTVVGTCAPLSVPEQNWNMDFTQNTAVTIANNGTYDPGPGSGMWVISEAASGDTAVLLMAAGGVNIVSQIGTIFTTTLGTATKINVALNAGPPQAYRIQNLTGATINLTIAMLRVRSSN